MEINPALSAAAPDGDADADAAKANSSDDTICDAVQVCIDCYRRLYVLVFFLMVYYIY